METCQDKSFTRLVNAWISVCCFKTVCSLSANLRAWCADELLLFSKSPPKASLTPFVFMLEAVFNADCARSSASSFCFSATSKLSLRVAISFSMTTAFAVDEELDDVICCFCIFASSNAAIFSRKFSVSAIADVAFSFHVVACSLAATAACALDSIAPIEARKPFTSVFASSYIRANSSFFSISVSSLLFTPSTRSSLAISNVSIFLCNAASRS
mmetsp:Transcript_4968/g.15930  ORF Transcript_4968/g.15930 Transcript_4968/m.15930 type:complete len:214 (-) Transcript_4968:1022-1663(-)